VYIPPISGDGKSKKIKIFPNSYDCEEFKSLFLVIVS